jgi:acyl-CoA thioester hydrolase
MDSFQHINNVQYLKFQENARLKFFDEFLKEINPDQFDIKAFDNGTGIGPILSNTSCSYKFPLTYPDKILVGATILDGDMSKDKEELTRYLRPRHEDFTRV